jgi:hypothetical protein
VRAAVLCLSLTLAGCAGLTGPTCPDGLTRAKTAELFFGRNVAGTEGVSDADWTRFVETEIVPRFPDGFTITGAAGAWKAKVGGTARERTERLFVVLTGAPGEEAKLAAIRAAYRARFGQDSVMLFESEGCVTF